MAIVIAAGGFGGKSQTTGVQDVYKFDAVVSVTPRRTSTITKNPVESGGAISDHVYLENTTIDMVGVISNSAIPMRNSALVFGDNRIVTDTVLTGDKIQSAYDVLVNIFNTREIITISTEFDSYDNCIIRSLSLPRTPQIGETMRAEITLEQMQVVQSERLDATVAVEIADTAASNKSKGEGDSVNPDSKTASEEQKAYSSRLSSVLNTYGGG